MKRDEMAVVQVSASLADAAMQPVWDALIHDCDTSEDRLRLLQHYAAVVLDRRTVPEVRLLRAAYQAPWRTWCADEASCGCCFAGAPEHIHHIIPLAYGGSVQNENLIVVCRLCHYLIHRGRMV